MARLRTWKGLSMLVALALVLALGIVAVPMAGTAADNGDKGSFDVLVFENGDWQPQGELSFSDYETRELQLDNDAGHVSIKLVQHGHDGAYVDYVALHKDSATYLPTGAINVDSNTNILDKIMSPDYDVCDAWNSALEIAWDNVPASTTLVMQAMEEDLGIGHGGPLYYPDIHRGETLGYTLVNDGGITPDGVLEETTAPAFSVFWQPDSPHPDGYTYGWLHCDQDYLYAAVEVTADNTLDEEDWGAFYVMVAGALEEFRISCDANLWGTNGFQYTSSVVYEHRIYEFQIPLAQIDAGIGDEIHYGFGCYGTGAVKPYQVWVDDSWGCQADVNLFDPSLTWHYDAFNKTQEGITAVHEDGTIHVRAGKYDEHLVINKSLTLQSTDGWQNTAIDPPPQPIIRISGHVDVTVQGFEMSAGASGIDVGNNISTVNILDCFIHGNSGFGIHVAGVDETSSVTIGGNVISENGDDGINFGVGVRPVFGNVIIRDNIIGAWTDYSKGSGTPQRYQGNGGEGIQIWEVGESGIVTIEDNKISENAWVQANTGVSIGNTYEFCGMYGVVTIAGNDIGAWEDDHGEEYFGNWGEGIYVGWVHAGAVLAIGPDNRIGKNTDDGIEIFNAQPAGAATITIHHNTIDSNGSDGIELGTPCEVDGATISHNTITNNGEKGIFLTGPSDHNIISDNEISNNVEGIRVEGSYNQILRNNILNNNRPPSGIHLTSTALGNIIHCNNIEGNHNGVYNENVNEVVDAIGNWWGDASGPSGAGPGSGDAVSGNVNYSSWLPAAFQYCRECQGAPATAVPTVNHWGIVAMITLFGGLLVWTVRRRPAASRMSD